MCLSPHENECLIFRDYRIVLASSTQEHPSFQTVRMERQQPCALLEELSGLNSLGAALGACQEVGECQ